MRGRDGVTFYSWRRHLAKFVRLWWPSWRRHPLIPKNPFWPVKLWWPAWRRHIGRHGYYSSDLAFCRFLHFYAPKTSEIASFVKFLSKVPKMTKETIWGNIWSNNHNLGLKWPPKSVTLFALSNIPTLGICLSSSKCAFPPIKIRVRVHLTLI